MLGVVVVAGISGGSNDGGVAGAEPGGATTLLPTDSAVTTVPITQEAVVTASTLEPIVKTQLAGPITSGSFGDDVRQLQQRLTDLGFAPGPVDGQFGAGTQQAVWAYKKLVGGMTFQERSTSRSR